MMVYPIYIKETGVSNQSYFTDGWSASDLKKIGLVKVEHSVYKTIYENRSSRARVFFIFYIEELLCFSLTLLNIAR